MAVYDNDGSLWEQRIASWTVADQERLGLIARRFYLAHWNMRTSRDFAYLEMTEPGRTAHAERDGSTQPEADVREAPAPDHAPGRDRAEAHAGRPGV